MERSEAPTSSPNRWARGESKEGNGGGAAWCRAEEGEWEREGGRGTTAWTMGSEWLQAAWSEAVARTHVGGGQANRGRRWGAGDAVRLTGGVGQ
jgi:hypothetical protein